MGKEGVNALFEGRKLVIATKHRKEAVLGPILEKELGVEILIPEGLDTDLLGTFSGEIERKEDPITTAERKCEWAMDITGMDLALASEGSFGAHPAAFFLPADEEHLLLIDKKLGLKIHARHISTETNFNAQKFESKEELREFAEKALFPSHGLILKGEKGEIFKGIIDWKALKEKAQGLLNQYAKARVETDMRALFNPSRMKVIEETAFQLIKQINSCCPTCSKPGFWVSERESGLPCSWCGSPTESTLAHRYSCDYCQHSERRLFPNGKEEEDPMYCNRCNP